VLEGVADDDRAVDGGMSVEDVVVVAKVVLVSCVLDTGVLAELVEFVASILEEDDCPARDTEDKEDSGGATCLTSRFSLIFGKKR
jgi:hypothetical protein